MMEPDAPPAQSLISHLLELRSRLLRALVAVLVCMGALLPFANRLYALLARPMIESLPQGASMIATGVAAPFMVPFKFAGMLAVYLAMPYVLYQVWAFVAPGLYRRSLCLCWSAALCCSTPAWRSPTFWCFRWCWASSPRRRRPACW